MRLPEHGTYSRYLRHACRCTPCRDAARSYRRRSGYDRVNGVARRLDSTQSRVHAERLTARGWTRAQIAAAAGISTGAVQDLVTARTATVSRRTATAVLAVALDGTPPIPRRMVDATGTRRRLQALMVLGHSIASVAHRARVAPSSLEQTAEGRWDMIRSTTAAAVARIYRHLAVAPAPQSRWSEQARNHAAAQGWHGPMAWADIDDPRCEPEPDEPPAPQHVHADDVAELAARGLTDEEIGRRLGVSPRTVLRARVAHGIPSGVAA